MAVTSVVERRQGALPAVAGPRNSDPVLTVRRILVRRTGNAAAARAEVIAANRRVAALRNPHVPPLPPPSA
ncbi:hypothetical protein [Streptomyces sp. NPDC058683]|uniref:hypothetical protein n=1 Tax=Streptomyces sp. NPDC058683 TaxID=3346597 RepID=UPI003649BEF8